MAGHLLSSTAKRRRDSESGGTPPSMEYNTVFVDTSLDTHLVMLLSDSDTVLDFKKKIMLEHAQCFPKIGEMWIHSLKVKRRGNFYHLPDFMFVWSAFHRVRGSWFLSADASCYTNQKSSLHRTNDHCIGLSSDANETPALRMSLPDGVAEENIISEMIDGLKLKKYSDKTTLETEFPAKKKQKMRYNEDLGHSPTLENTQILVAGEDSLQPLLVGCGVDTDGEAPDGMPGYENTRKLTLSEATAEVSGVRYGHSNMEHSDIIGTSVPSPEEKSNFGNGETSVNVLGLHNRKEDLVLNDVMPEVLMAEIPQNKLGQNVPSTHLEGNTCNTSALGKKRNSKRRKNQLPHDQVANPKPSSSEYVKEGRSADFPGNVALSGTSGVLEREQCEPLSVEVKKSAAPCPLKGTGIKEPDTDHLELKVDNINRLFEPKVKRKASSENNDFSIIDGKNKETDWPDIDEAPKKSSLSHDLVLMQSESLGTRHEARESTRRSVQPDDFLDANGEMEHGNRSKRKAKKSGRKIRDKTVDKHTDNVMHLTQIVPVQELNTLKHHETEKVDSILPTAETDLNAGSEEDRGLSVNYQSDFNLGEVVATLKESNLSVGLVDTNCAVEGSKPNGIIGKKKRAQKAVANIQHVPDIELKTKEGDSIGSCIKTNKSDKKDEERELFLNHDLEVIPPYNKTSSCADPLLTPTEVGSTAKLSDAYFLEEPEISHGRRKKKRVQKSADINLDRSGMERTGQKTDQPDIYEEQREPSLNQDPALTQPENLESLNLHEVDGNIKEAVQPELFSFAKETELHIKNKRRAKKSRDKIQDGTDGEHSDNGVHLTPSAVPNLYLTVLNDHETKRTDGILPTVETDLAVESNEDRNLLLNHEPDMNQPEEGVTVKEPKLSARLMDAMVASKDGNLNGNKRKKKKSRKAAGKFRETSDLEHEARKGEGVEPHSDLRKFEKSDVGRGLSPNYDCEVMVPLSSKATECADPELKLKEAGSTSKFLEGDMVVEPQSSGGHGGKRRVNNSVDTNLEKSDMEHINHGTSGSSAVLLCPPTNHIPEETGRGGCISVHKGKDVRMKLLDAFVADAEEKVTGTDENKSEFLKLTQTMDDVGINEKETKKKSSTSDCHKVPPAKLKGYQGENLTRNQAQNNSENVLNKDKKTKKKTKRQLVASDVQQNPLTRDQEVRVEVFATQENVSSFLNSELDGRHVDSSQVMSQRVEEKIEEFHETAGDTDDLARSFQNKDEGINFKHYFVQDRKQDKTASGDKVKKANKSREVMNTGIKVKKHGLPSLSTSTELQSPLKSYESKDGKKQSLVRSVTDKKDGDSAVNSNWNEANSSSPRKSLRVRGNGVRNSSPTEMLGMSTLQKQSETTATSSFVKEKNLSLDKSSLGRSGAFPENRGDKSWQTELNVSNKTAIKIPQKSSLLMKVGAIFRESSGESSGDNNRTAYSDSSTCSPSDSSSLSGCSEGESDLSQASARNGSNDAKGRSGGGKNISKLDLSASNELTMDMILRSSKRFKKAKIIASQNELEQTESQAMEIVPESQPNQ